MLLLNSVHTRFNMEIAAFCIFVKNKIVSTCFMYIISGMTWLICPMKYLLSISYVQNSFGFSYRQSIEPFLHFKLK